MIKKIALMTFILLSLSSCVSKKIYYDLENKYTDLKKENHNLADENEELKKLKSQLEVSSDSLKSELAKLKSERDKLQTDCAATANARVGAHSAQPERGIETGRVCQSALPLPCAHSAQPERGIETCSLIRQIT